MIIKRRVFAVLGVSLLLAAILAGAGVWRFIRARSMSYGFVMQGGRSSSGEYSVSSGNVFAVSGKPAVVFSTVKKPGAREELIYVLVFRRLPSGLSLGSRGLPIDRSDFGSSGDGRQLEDHAAFSIGGKRIEARYEVEFNEARTAATVERLTVGGESKDLAAGRVFLVDLAGQSPTYKQKTLNSPPMLSPLQSSDDVERLAEAILKALESQDDEAKRFLR